MTMGTRIVVMKDGFIQQVDSPTNLYLHPVNIFVAGFMGMPPMNFINATLSYSPETVKLSFGDNTISLTNAKYLNGDLKEFDGKEVIMGVRPEAISDDPATVEASVGSTFRGDIDVVELLGAEAMIYLTCGAVSLTARVDPPTTRAKVGDSFMMALDAERIHIFDKEPENSLVL